MAHARTMKDAEGRSGLLSDDLSPKRFAKGFLKGNIGKPKIPYGFPSPSATGLTTIAQLCRFHHFPLQTAPPLRLPPLPPCSSLAKPFWHPAAAGATAGGAAPTRRRTGVAGFSGSHVKQGRCWRLLHQWNRDKVACKLKGESGTT